MRRLDRRTDVTGRSELESIERPPLEERFSLPAPGRRLNVDSLVKLQRSAGNAAVVRMISDLSVQCNRGAAQSYTPQNRGDSMIRDFRLHHTPNGRLFDRNTCEAIAIANHTGRATPGLNTTLDMNNSFAQREIEFYLHDLDDTASGNLETRGRIDFTTRGEYLFVTTEWNGGNPRSRQLENGKANLTMQWTAGGYYQIYHLTGMS